MPKLVVFFKGICLNLLCVPVLIVNTPIVITLPFTFSMFNLCLSEENFPIVIEAIKTAVDKLLNLDMSLLALTEDEMQADKYLLHHLFLCSNGEKCPF